MKTLLWLFWPNSGQDACRTVQDLPDLLVLPSQLTWWKPTRTMLLSLEWDSAVTSTIYNSVPSSKVFIACSVHSRRRLSPSLSAKIPELTTLWSSISRIVRTSDLVDHGGFLLHAAMNWSRSASSTRPVHYSVSWLLSTSISINSHPIAYSFMYLLLLVLRKIV